MDVKELPKIKKDTGLSSPQNSGQSSGKLTKATSLSAAKLSDVASESVKVQLSSGGEKALRSEPNEKRRNANKVIEALNVVSEGADQIRGYLTSLSGIVEQADSSPDNRKKVLEREAQGLIQAIAKTAEQSTSSGIKPLRGEPVALESADSIEKTLEFVFPDTSTAFGLNQEVDFLTRESIVSTRERVNEARKQLERAEKNVNSVRDKVAEAINELDVSLANLEASGSTVREVEDALSLARDLGVLFVTEPEKAVRSNELSPRSLSLLEE